jgi:CBS domain-containing protein
MNLYQKSSVGIVNDQGQMVANLSLADFRGFTVDHLRFLLYPITEYIQQVHKIDPMTKNICCTKDKDFLDVIERMVRNQVHRVWVVHEGGTIPMGVVTMTDLLVATYDRLL